MTMIEEGKVDRVYVIRLDDGKKVISTLQDILKKRGIRNGCLTMIGAVRNLEIKTPNPTTKEHYTDKISDNMEIMAAGNISVDGSEIFIHLHATTGKKGGSAFTGHVVEAEVHDFVEIIITTFSGLNLVRKKDRETGLVMLVANRSDGEQ